MAAWTPYAAGAVAGALIAWALTQWYSIARIRKIADERDDLRRQLQESLDERETEWNEANAACSEDFAVLTAATWSHDYQALAMARDRVCRGITMRIIPKYLQLIRRRVLYHKNEWDHCLAIVADATQELRNWEYVLSVVNDEWLLDETRQEACRLNRYELTALMAEVDRAVQNSEPAAQFAKACTSLIESCCENS